MKAALLVLAVVALFAMAGLVVSERSGMVTVCPEDMAAVYEPVIGGGLQLVACMPPGSVDAYGPLFDTYYQHPAGDIRRQRIAQYGYG